MLKIDLKNIPSKTGVYLFKDKNGNVLYVGKAKNLRNRLKQYFLSPSLKVKKLLEETEKIEFLETENEALAIFKESDLIKKFNPPYNQLLRDDTRYFYLVFTQETFPKVLITHQPEKFKTKEIIGPFFEGSSLKEILKIIRKEIPYCTCLIPHSRTCLNALLNLCFGFCCQKTINFSKKDIHHYNENLKIIKKIFTSDLSNLKKSLLNQMKTLLKEDKLEEAERLKRAYLAIKKIEIHQDLIKEKETFLMEHQIRKILVKLKEKFGLEKLPHRIEALDISHFAGKEKVGVIVTFLDGEYEPSLLRKFKIKTVLKPDDPRMIYEVLKRRFRHQEWGLPDLILVDGGKIQLKFALKALEESGLKIKIIALAKPKENVYYDFEKAPFNLKEDQELRDFILSLDKKTHQIVIKYHRQKREKLKLG